MAVSAAQRSAVGGAVAVRVPTVGVGAGLDGQGGLPLPWLAPALQAALALHQAHALLLVGPAGAGHLELGLVLAQAQLCERAEPGQPPCGECVSCHLVQQRTHPDLLLVLPDALRAQYGWLGDDESRLAKADAKPSRDLRIAQVRDAIAWGQQTSGRGRGKVMLLHPADALNASAANALLKTLEEPPGALRLLLTSADAERLLPTLRSRCQRVQLGLPSAAVALAWLASQGLRDAEPVLRLAGGSPLEALALAAEGLSAEALAALPRRVAAGDVSALTGRPVPRVLDLLLKLSHDAQVVAAGGAPRFFAANSLPDGAALPALAAWQRGLLRTARHAEHTWNAGLLVESLVSQAAGVWPGLAGPATRPARMGAGATTAAGAANKPWLHSER